MCYDADADADADADDDADADAAAAAAADDDDDDNDDDDDDTKPVWPTWAVDVLSGVREVETYNCDARLRGLSGVSQIPGIHKL